MIEFVLMGAQAAGMIGGAFSDASTYKAAKRGQQMDEAQANLRIRQERVAANEQGLFQLEELREVLATQRAMMSVRGGQSGVGSALAAEQKSISNFKRDEQARERSLQWSKSQHQARLSLGRMGLAGMKSQMAGQQFQRSFDMIPFTQMAGGLGGGQKPAAVSTAKPSFSRPGALTGSGSSSG